MGCDCAAIRVLLGKMGLERGMGSVAAVGFLELGEACFRFEGPNRGMSTLGSSWELHDTLHDMGEEGDVEVQRGVDLRMHYKSSLVVLDGSVPASASSCMMHRPVLEPVCLGSWFVSANHRPP